LAEFFNYFLENNWYYCIKMVWSCNKEYVLEVLIQLLFVWLFFNHGSLDISFIDIGIYTAARGMVFVYHII
jgi:predicted NAD/FAD-binding protein